VKKRILISALVKDVTGFLESVFARCGKENTEICPFPDFEWGKS